MVTVFIRWRLSKISLTSFIADKRQCFKSTGAPKTTNRENKITKVSELVLTNCSFYMRKIAETVSSEKAIGAMGARFTRFG